MAMMQIIGKIDNAAKAHDAQALLLLKSNTKSCTIVDAVKRY